MNEALARYLDQWELSHPELLAKTFTSDLYKVEADGQTAVLKILSEAGAKDERCAAHVLKWYSGHGAIQLLRHDLGAMLLEYVDGGDLTELVKNGRDDEATKIIADVLNTLHFASRSEILDHLTRYRSAFNLCSIRRTKTESRTPFTDAAQQWPAIFCASKARRMFFMATSTTKISASTKSVAGWLSTPRA
jgi:streptomycin 6-kinase